MSVTDEVVQASMLPEGRCSIDQSRSKVEFSLKHMVFKTVHGCFNEFEGTLETAHGLASASGRVVASSIDTGDSVRDDHLRRSRDFFDIDRHPYISFASEHVGILDDGRVHIEGELTMRGQTRGVSLDGHLRRGGAGTSAGTPDGGETITLTLQGEARRSDFGLVWNQTLDSGGVLLGDSVAIALEITAVSSASASP